MLLNPSLYLATHNVHKRIEIAEILLDCALHFDIKPLPKDFTPVIESGSTFEENATLKSTALKQIIADSAWSLADDSGLEVDALNGAPGVYSARYAGEHASDANNNLKLLANLTGVPPHARTARFHCVLSLQVPNSINKTFHGTCEGHILTQTSGNAGFGYDPLFQPVGYTKTFAELTSDEKNRISHRSKALRAMAEWLQKM